MLEALVGTAVLQVRVRDVLILVGGCWWHLVSQLPVRLVSSLDLAEPASNLLVQGSGPFCSMYSSILYWGQWAMGNAGASSTTRLAERTGLCVHCCGESAACRLSMDRRRTARGGGAKSWGSKSCGIRGSDCEGVTDTDGLLSIASSLMVCFQLHCHARAPPQPMLLCAEESLPADGIVAPECWLNFSCPCMHWQEKKWF